MFVIRVRVPMLVHVGLGFERTTDSDHPGALLLLSSDLTEGAIVYVPFQTIHPEPVVAVQLDIIQIRKALACVLEDYLRLVSERSGGGDYDT